ncbi:DNA cytosine methyltransferase [Microlunatus aurantiacus]|uniref:DNA cytosine methyltransferase n=1 Tax=Microlunatus aurantiacus TaxID=446786 RepID=UPI003CD0C414
MTFSFVDLFAGVGGFHAALAGLGGECWFVSEIDRAAAAVYEANWLPAADAADRKLQRVDGASSPSRRTRCWSRPPTSSPPASPASRSSSPASSTA